MIRIFALIGSIAAILLGGLWLIQGLGLVQIRPILYFADCVTIQGPSSTRAITGAFTLLAGAIGAVWSSRLNSK